MRTLEFMTYVAAYALACGCLFAIPWLVGSFRHGRKVPFFASASQP